MPRIEYVPHTFSAATLRTIGQAESIAASYRAQGYDLTLRQLYYQFVARGLLPNKDTEYKRLGAIVNDARLAGLLDWDYIVDRTRNLRTLGHWDSPADIIQATAYSFRVDAWARQPERVEVWIEKDALVGVIQRPCERNDVPYFSCRGYTSQSEVWGAAQRIEGYLNAIQDQDPDGAGGIVTIIHLGDHDPSGLDMTRDIEDRLRLFLDGDGYDPDDVQVERIALNMDQVVAYSPPPNPAKWTDSRASAYVNRWGAQSWELDALDPPVLDALIQEAIERHRDDRLWAEAQVEQANGRAGLQQAAERWDDVRSFLGRPA